MNKWLLKQRSTQLCIELDPFAKAPEFIHLHKDKQRLTLKCQNEEDATEAIFIHSIHKRLKLQAPTSKLNIKRFQSKMLEMKADTRFCLANFLVIHFPHKLLKSDSDVETFCTHLHSLGYQNVCFQASASSIASPLIQEVEQSLKKLKTWGIGVYLQIELKDSRPDFFALLPQNLSKLFALLPSLKGIFWPAQFVNVHSFTPEENRDMSLLEKAQKEFCALEAFSQKVILELPDIQNHYFTPSCEFLEDFFLTLPQKMKVSLAFGTELFDKTFDALASHTPLSFAQIIPKLTVFSAPFGKGLWPELPTQKIESQTKLLLALNFQGFSCQAFDLPAPHTPSGILLSCLAFTLSVPLDIPSLSSRLLKYFHPDSSLKVSDLDEVSQLSQALKALENEYKNPKQLASSLLIRSQLLEQNTLPKQKAEEDILYTQLRYFLRDYRKLILYYLGKKDLSLPQALTGDDLKESFFAHTEKPSAQGIGRAMKVELFKSESEICFDESMETMYKQLRFLTRKDEQPCHV